MTTVTADFKSNVGLTPGPNDYVAVYRKTIGVSPSGQVITTQRREYSISDGSLTITGLSPGDNYIYIHCGEWQDEYPIVTPESGTHSLWELIEPFRHYPGSAVKAAQRAAIQALASAAAAAAFAQAASDYRDEAQRLDAHVHSDMADMRVYRDQVRDHVQALAEPNDAAVLGLISPGAESATRDALDSSYGPRWAEETRYDAQRMAALLKPTGEGAYVRRTDAGVEIGHAVTSADAVAFHLSEFEGPGGYGLVPQIHTCRVGRADRVVDKGNPEFSYSGAWSTATYDGVDVTRSDTTGDTVTWTVPATSSRISARLLLGGGNGGYWRATASNNSGAVVCDGLPTAQDEVDAGRLDSSSLTTNGGTLSPSTRLLDAYGAGSMSSSKAASVMLIANASQSREHIVTLECTGYHRSASSGDRIYLAGGSVGYYQSHIGPTSGLSAWEYAMAITPASGGRSITIGCVHGYEELVGLSTRVDGQVISLGVGGKASGAHAALYRTTNLYHPDYNGVLGTTEVTYTAVPGDGLWVDRKIMWNTDVVVNFYFPVMWPNSLRKGRFAGGEAFDVNHFDGRYTKGGRTLAYAAWTPGSDWAGMCEVDPLSVDFWRHTEVGATLEDRSSSMAKLYVPWLGTAVSGDTAPNAMVAAGTEWRSRSVYRVARAPMADTALS